MFQRGRLLTGHLSVPSSAAFASPIEGPGGAARPLWTVIEGAHGLSDKAIFAAARVYADTLGEASFSRLSCQM